MSELNCRTAGGVWRVENWLVQEKPLHLVSEVKHCCVSIGTSISLLVGVREVGFARTALPHGNVEFGRRKDERVGDEEP